MKQANLDDTYTIFKITLNATLRYQTFHLSIQNRTLYFATFDLGQLKLNYE